MTRDEIINNLVRNWVRKANNDLITAERELSFDDPVTETICFHLYAVEQIYVQKILAIIGIQLAMDSTGRGKITGRNEARDVVDLYFLSRKVLPLLQFLKKIQRNQQHGLVQ